MTFTDRMIARAYKLLKKYGSSVHIKRTVPGTYVPATGVTSAPVVTTYDGFGLIQYITRTSANQFYGTSTLQSSLIQKDDEMCFLILDNKTIIPTNPIDRLVVGTKEYNVVFATALKSGNTDVMYVIQIRK